MKLRWFWPLALAALVLWLPLLAKAEDDPAAEAARDMQTMQVDAQSLLDQLQAATHAATERGLQPDGLWKMREKIMHLASDEAFLKAAQSLWNNPQRKTLFWAQGIFFVLMIVFKAWRQSKASNWFTKMLIGFVITLFTWAVISLVLPAVILGEPFRVFVGHLWRALSA